MRRAIAAGTILISAILLFAGLGHYALWDDEAVTALAAEGVWRTGDTSVILDHNIVAYRNGLLLKGTHERSTPPLGAYLAAPFLGIFGHTSFVARLPFAFIGLASVGLMLWWLYTLNASWMTYLLLGLAIIGNVSFQLYCRQCRYYSPAIFSSILIAYLYVNWNGSRWQLVLMAVAGIVLLASNYLNYVALHACLLLDYAIVGRKRKWLTWSDWLIVLGPQIVIGGIIVGIWNTLGTGNVEYIKGNSLAQRIELVWMNLRDMNACEFGVGLLIIAAPILYFLVKDPWLWRAPLALLIYTIVVSFLSPQTLSTQSVLADVRYMAAAIPLCIAIGVLVLAHAARLSYWLALGVAFIGFGTNLLNGAPLGTRWLGVRSTLSDWVTELIQAPPDPYRPTEQWINAHVKDGDSVLVIPDYATYPLMFHAPKAVYAGQLKDPPPPAFSNVAPIHIAGRALPDYVICMGPSEMLQQLVNRPQSGNPYQLVDHIDVNGTRMYRPELLLRSFKAQPVDWQQGNAIYIFKKKSLPSADQGLRL
jgi:4-amino-4-deoxy-L-arabinose transferase-like glycosyltransferase